MILNMDIDLEELANAITLEAEYSDIVELILRIEEIEADSVFTDMLYDAVEERMVDMHKDYI